MLSKQTLHHSGGDSQTHNIPRNCDFRAYKSTTQSVHSNHASHHTCGAFLARRLCFPGIQQTAQRVISEHTIHLTDCAFLTYNPPHTVLFSKHFPTHFLFFGHNSLCFPQFVFQIVISEHAFPHTLCGFFANSSPHNPQSGFSYHHTVFISKHTAHRAICVFWAYSRPQLVLFQHTQHILHFLGIQSVYS